MAEFGGERSMSELRRKASLNPVDAAHRIAALEADLAAAQKREQEVGKALELAGVLVAEIPCQQMMTMEDCSVDIVRHVRHPERYEKLPVSEWCERCKALDVVSRAALSGERDRG